ncbi:MAG: hypothetical protein JW708_02755, partial [Vallitaleaceae bacterium]|nr:hypothetical protein [Vallitaleaceae bacterium]
MRYVKCDFHGHTNYSDGHMDLESAIASAIAQGLDCIAITEHNILREEKIRSSIPVFSSFELTLEKGHLNIHGWEGPIVINNDAEQINELLKHYEKASFITMNHPFFEPWHFHNQWMEIHRIDGIEVICDPTYPGSGEASRKALDFLMF